MEKYYFLAIRVLLVCLVIAVILLTKEFVIFRKHMRTLASFTHNVAISHNESVYALSRYIVADLTVKAAERELTPEEQDYFHFCRQNIFQYEQSGKSQAVPQ